MMWRKLTILLISLSFCWTTFACSSPNSTQSYPNPNNNTSVPRNQLSQGQYSVQQATYNDANGEYSIMLLNTPAGTPPVYRTENLQMARLTDAEVAEGKQTYLEINGSQAAMHLTPDFKIEYVHNVTETQTNPQTGQRETVIVRQQSGFWAPFAGAVAGQALGSLLFRPTYYVPPVYQSGGLMRGYGGYGSTYNEAVNRYQTRYQAPPPAVRNRQTFRTTGGLRRPSSTTTRPTVVRPTPNNANRSTGSGYGSSRLRPSNQSRPSRTNSPSRFGSGTRRPSRRSGGAFGSPRRR